MKHLSDLERIDISVVSYLNTLPFLYGLTKSEYQTFFNIKQGTPAQCFKLFQSNQTDISLIPVGALVEAGDCKIIAPYCISAYKNVDSVLLLSNSSLEKIETIYTDPHSLTSNKLIQVICNNLWSIQPNFKSPNNNNHTINQNEAFVAIGDKTFNLANKYKYSYDLAKLWHELTGLPFVFAVWTTKKDLPRSTIDIFNKSLEIGINSIKKSIDYFNPKIISKKNSLDYLTNKIKYELSDNSIKGMKHFLSLISPSCPLHLNFI